MRRARAILTAGCLFMAALIISGPPAVAAPQPVPATVRADVIFPGIPHWFAKPQNPPLEPLLRFYMLEHTLTYPQSFRGLICLHQFKIAGRGTVRKFPCAKITFADLAAPGDTVTWHIGEPPYSTWYCQAHRRYFVSFSWHGVSDTGVAAHAIRYSPYHEGSRIAGESGWGRRPPDRREAHKQTSCKAVKGA